jgi:hypothetical protein
MTRLIRGVGVLVALAACDGSSSTDGSVDAMAGDGDVGDGSAGDTGADGPAGCTDYAPSDGPKATGAKVVPVATAAALLDAIGKANPGDAITLAPGTYRLNANVPVNRPGTSAQRIFVRAQQPLGATIELCSTEGFQVSAADWIFEDLVIKGVCPGPDDNEHAFHITGAAHETILRYNKVVDFKSHVKLNLDNTTSRIWPNDTWYIGNVWMDTAAQPGAKPFNALNIDGGRRHIVRGNRFVDLVSVEDRRASAIYPKITTRDMIVEQNLIICQKRVTGGGDRAGISTGEAWNPSPYCDTDCANVGNVYRNNIVIGCNGPGNSFGIGVGYEKSTVYLHNTEHAVKRNYFNGNANSSGADVVFVGNILYEDWLFDGPGRPTQMATVIAKAAGAAAMFVDAAHGDFTLKDGSAIRGKLARDSRAPHDFCGHCRADTTDIGAIDYSDPRATQCLAAVKSMYDGL